MNAAPRTPAAEDSLGEMLADEFEFEPFVPDPPEAFDLVVEGLLEEQRN